MKSKFNLKVESRFHDKELLNKALTHSSYSSEENLSRNESNERLEFLGDAFFNAIIGEELFKRYPRKSEGELTKYRALIVCEDSLALVAKEINLGKYLRLGKGEERNGGRERVSILADGMEAVIGAFYLDSNYSNVKNLVLDLFQPIITDATSGKIEKDYKSMLQEEAQKRGEVKIEYRISNESGPSHEKSFTSAVIIEGSKKGEGQGRSKKEAEQKAAKNALVKEGIDVL